MNWVKNKKRIQAMTLLFIACATVSLKADLLNIGGNSDDNSFLSIGGDEGLVHVGSSAYKQGQMDEKNNKRRKSYIRSGKQKSYDQGREDMRNQMGSGEESEYNEPQKSTRTNRSTRTKRRYEHPQTQKSYSDLNAHGPMYGSDVEAMR